MNQLVENYPNVLLLDLNFSCHSNNLLISLRDRFPNLKIILLSEFEDYILNNFILKNQADAYVNKNCSVFYISELIKSLFCDESFTQELIKGSPFTPTQQMVISLMCFGHTFKEIAVRLNVTQKAIEAHRQRIYRKLNVKSKAEFMSYALRHGLMFFPIPAKKNGRQVFNFDNLVFND